MKPHSFMELFHRAMPLIKVAVVMYISATAALWAAVRALSPAPIELSLARGLCSVFLMTITGNLLQGHLESSMGHWALLIKLAVDVLIVKFSFSLSFLRSTAVAVVYCTAVMLVFFLYTHPHPFAIFHHAAAAPHR